MSLMSHLSEPVKLIIDAISTVGAILAFVTQLLPALASLASLIWACIRIYEWYKLKKEDKNANERINRLDS